MSNIFVLVGLPGSGKSDIAEKIGARAIIVSFDNFREMLNGKYKFDSVLEDLVWSIGHFAIKEALDKRYNVVIDETLLSINKKQRSILLKILRKTECDGIKHNITAIQLNTRPDICKMRRIVDDKGLGGMHWVRLIDELAMRYELITDDNNEGFDTVRFES